ncbi:MULTISPECIES: AraC family transcriptional regulator [Bradyrhizobium]|uniref:AraC family transcriptional regulator n=1 Tax=Bradyrhizobium nanningense TaxID=1325118 RepID=A0A4Q0S1K5_9BRAD|nr:MULTISPECIES: AraC family transcriptional regulator [Bradyrhizobium]RXH25852.1 AraC family transcriptional regulator [Bradyrhizobium nanningense]RXH28730.1 AraC family transcriptional regulator [Bradyrhizobium nanningense]TQF30070.1 AraC family transcriptional regulator [Bradyrhizobium sp. UNPA324]
MNPAQRALWYIESHLAEPMTLDEIAAISGVSRFHIVRAFAAATGLPVIRYVRARRLTEAARSLADGAPDILSLALEADYGSHEAFTRAFRDQFGTTPEAVRAASCASHLKLQEPILMDSTMLDHLAPPRFETVKAFLVAGPAERISCDNGAMIPGLWQRFHQEVADIPARVGQGKDQVAYGVCCNGDDAGNFDYIAGVEVADFSDLPRRFGRIRIPQQRYAVFTHTEHVASIRRTVNTIWNQWLPASGLEAADAPSFERYGEAFDPATGNGGFEIWVPVRE